MPVVSVIVPIYNVDAYLDRCIQSIITQTLKDIEIILVNDGSTDTSLDICRNYERRDNRIKIINQTNQGLSEARNAGLKIAAGKYVAFVDSDDFIENDMYTTLLEIMEQHDADLVQCSYYRSSQQGNIPFTNTNEVFVYTSKQFVEEILKANVLYIVAWNKLYKTEYIRQEKFPKGKYHEDEFWTYRVAAQMGKLIHIDIPKYYYVIRENSIMKQPFNMKRLDVLEAFSERIKYIESMFPDLTDLANKAYLECALGTFYQLSINNHLENSKSFQEKIRKDISSKYSVLCKHRAFTMKNRLQLLVFKCSGKIYSAVISFVNKRKRIVG